MPEVILRSLLQLPNAMLLRRSTRQLHSIMMLASPREFLDLFLDRVSGPRSKKIAEPNPRQVRDTAIPMIGRVSVQNSSAETEEWISTSGVSFAKSLTHGR
jgi:hypothetical protein